MGRARIAIIGAGPIGLEAALLAVESGFDCNIYERGRVAENVLCWGHVRLFSPFGLNASGRGRTALADSPFGEELPHDDDFLTGHEFTRRYLVPLSRLPRLTNRIHEQTEVAAVGRSRTGKRELIGMPLRAADPFQLLIRDARGERRIDADYVFDCSGTYPHHNWCGAGGIPCVGEMEAAAEIEYGLPDLLGLNRDRYVGRTTLVVGDGYSAATAIISLARLAEIDQRTKVVWLTRRPALAPIHRIDGDSLLERDKIAAKANDLALAVGGPVDWRPATLIREIRRDADGSRFRIACEQTAARASAGREGEGGAQQTRELIVDRVIANVGYRPDRSLYEELQVHECYASQGPIKLAAQILGASSTDCLAQPSHGADALVNPEPHFYILGSKSYGRDSRFLLKAGLTQVDDVFSLIGREEKL